MGTETFAFCRCSLNISKRGLVSWSKGSPSRTSAYPSLIFICSHRREKTNSLVGIL